jgi:hypothetical protein
MPDRSTNERPSRGLSPRARLARLIWREVEMPEDIMRLKDAWQKEKDKAQEELRLQMGNKTEFVNFTITEIFLDGHYEVEDLEKIVAAWKKFQETDACKAYLRANEEMKRNFNLGVHRAVKEENDIAFGRKGGS